MTARAIRSTSASWRCSRARGTTPSSACSSRTRRRARRRGTNAEAAPEVLRYGARGESVKRLQERLNQSGSAGTELKVDGIFGPLTTAAVRYFQKSHPPLEVDGAAGPEFQAELERVGDQGAPLPGASATSFLEKGKKLYGQGRYALAFDEFAKAHDLDPDPAYLYNMAQALPLVGGRREEAIKLFEPFIATRPEAGDLDRAKAHLAELRGPGPSGDQKRDLAKVDELYEARRKFFHDQEYGRAYDEFTKAWDIGHDPALLWNRAIALFEQVLTVDVPDENKAAAKREIEELRGPQPTGDEKKDAAAEDTFFKDAQAAFQAEDYAAAYDGFTRAWQVTYSNEMVWNRAQAARRPARGGDQAVPARRRVGRARGDPEGGSCAHRRPQGPRQDQRRQPRKLTGSVDGGATLPVPRCGTQEGNDGGDRRTSHSRWIS